MSKLEIGSTARHVGVVGDDDTAVALGSGDVPVLATPRLIAWMEAAAVSAVAGGLPSGATTVGTRIEVEHLAPSGRGATVEATAELSGVDERKLQFRITAVERRIDGVEVPIARGSHSRVIVDRDRFLGRIGS